MGLWEPDYKPKRSFKQKIKEWVKGFFYALSVFAGAMIMLRLIGFIVFGE